MRYHCRCTFDPGGPFRAHAQTGEKGQKRNPTLVTKDQNPGMRGKGQETILKGEFPETVPLCLGTGPSFPKLFAETQTWPRGSAQSEPSSSL